MFFYIVNSLFIYRLYNKHGLKMYFYIVNSVFIYRLHVSVGGIQLVDRIHKMPL